MAGRFMFPSPNRPSTAVGGIGDDHDDNLYSAGILAHNGVGAMKLFVSGQGSAIPQVTGSAITTSALPTHYQNYLPVTTVIEQSGMLGNSIGDAEVRAIGVTVDQCGVKAGVNNYYGATPYELIDICSKVRLEIKLSGKRRMLGALWMYPQTGGPGGFTNLQASSLAGNGQFPVGRKLRSPIQIARNDVLVAEVTVDAALAFSDTSFTSPHTGQASLIWVNMVGTVRSDVR